MRAEKLLTQEERIKFILNEKVFYYTREELREFYDKVYENSWEHGLSDDVFEGILANIEKYDGDPYGRLENPNVRKRMHEMLEMGLVSIIQ